ncbi:DUF4917 family protein [Bradyrhizobium sp. AUGA SZCCT0431]|uniref:DUF4917 family protein n=1 Tax=Bradyrhizobium sp. AUGA SZCCT0431 TaxID=2807674 RepID=UPI001BA95FA5|nr:DUF4917 family protein [Bradyrhizobium sp. AUGA SZCCT0431]MBR1141728.1 DUF4917 family protein [Bradyrhizobium sp. AUGA SZCCT0431]
MVGILSFEQALKKIGDAKRKHLLLGNGFSIALRPDIFTYGSLYENADFSKAPHVTKLFDALKTQDFEVVIKHLQDAATVVEVYRPSAVNLARSLRNDAAAIKDALVTAIAKRHPDRPYDVKPEQYAACRTFLSRFGHIFTLNYDVLLYWALMQSEVDNLQINHDDGFRHPEDDPDQPWVSWQQGNSATVCYLHGALHLFDAGSEITKYTWSKTDKPIVEQIRSALAVEKYPLFVAEGTSASKKARILHSGYLHKAHRSFEACCGAAGNAIVIYGHSLADNDDHVLRTIVKGNARYLLVSLYGDPNSSTNRVIVDKAEKLVLQRGPAKGRRQPLTVIYYDASSAKVWG